MGLLSSFVVLGPMMHILTKRLETKNGVMALALCVFIVFYVIDYNIITSESLLDKRHGRDLRCCCGWTSI